MPSELNPDEPQFQMHLIGAEEALPPLLDISSFLYDFNLLYEITRLATDPWYNDFKFSDFVLYRGGRPLKARDRIRVQSLKLQSPLDLVSLLPAVPIAIGAIWGVVQVAEKISNAKLNRRKLKAEVEKLERENQGGDMRVRFSMPESDQEVRRLLRIREAEKYYENVSGRLERSSVRIKELDIEIVQISRKRESE